MKQTKIIGMWTLALVIVGIAWFARISGVSAVPPADPNAAPAAPNAATAPLPSDPNAATEPVQDPNTATIIISTVPASTANVSWGRKLLGKIKPGKALVVKRPRDSGPLDIMVRAVGYLPVQTRAHTFSDNRVIVKLTKPENMMELWGYRAPGPDAGVLSPEEAAAQNAMAPSGALPLPVAPGTTPVSPSIPPPAPVPQ